MHPSALAYTLYKIPLGMKYTTFKIPKKSGGDRIISAPSPRLKRLQRSIADLLADCRKELEEKTPRKIVSHAFRKEASISTNARQHRKRHYVLNLDLENFFPTFNFGRVRGYFIKNKDFALNPSVATVIAQIACDGTALPQGSPCSPIISDLLGHILDVRLLKLARKYKCTYSRYADDLTFSTNQADFPEKIAFQVDAGASAWALGGELLSQLDRLGFSANHKKTRMQYRGSQQVVTGLTVNERVNIRASYYRGARKMCSALFATGTYHKPDATADASGKMPKGNIAQLEGILNHIYYIKEQEKIRTFSTEKVTAPKHGAERLYDRFLFFKKCVALSQPLVICEGKTDSIYLDAAIRHLPKYNGSLYSIVGGKKQSNIQYFNYTNVVQQVMSMGGGTSSFIPFIQRYEKMVARFKYAPLAHPVILLIDNDDGAKGVFSSLKHITINHTTPAPFYRISRNLYLVKTPEKPPPGYSMIEDLFQPALLGALVSGKSFNPAKVIDTKKEYGKAVFAERVVAPGAATIDFTGFIPLLDRVVAVIAHHATLVAKGAV